MKIFIIILSLGFSLIANAQVVSNLSFNNETKTVSLELRNQFNELVFLYPKRDGNDKKATYFTVKYKDVNGTILNSFAKYVFDRTDILLPPKESKSYKLKLSPNETLYNIHSVEIEVHIEVRNKLETLFVKDICKTYKW